MRKLGATWQLESDSTQFVKVTVTEVISERVSKWVSERVNKHKRTHALTAVAELESAKYDGVSRAIRTWYCYEHGAAGDDSKEALVERVALQDVSALSSMDAAVPLPESFAAEVPT